MTCERMKKCANGDYCNYHVGFLVSGCMNFKEKKPLTNEEWRKTCSTEDFAEWISNLAYACMRCGMSNGEAYCHTGYCIQDEADALMWLKQPHREE